ncbi:MAG: pseudouridine synthase [Pirellulaceae bacterium]
MAFKKSPRTSPARKQASRRPKARSKPSAISDPTAQRLNKILAAAGLGSRREVEELIVQGRVEIDREIVTDLSRKVDPNSVTIKVDGSVLKKQRLVYFALNKPTGVLSTNRDPDGRMRVIDLLPIKERVFSVGRLDRSSEGLILLTNDGELAQRLAHPKFSVQKSYFVVVSGVMQREELDKLRKGVHLAEGFARIDGATIRRQRKGCTELEIVLSEGKNREIRRILARAGHKVVVLRRIAIGPLRLGQLPVGASRQLNATEVRALYAITDKPAAKKKSPASASSSLSQSNKPAKLAKSPIAPESRSSRIEDDDDFGMDDFGFGSEELDEDDEFSLASAIGDEFDPENLNDDDFVGHFGSSTAGKVLGYDGDESPTPKPKRRPARGTQKQASSGGAQRRSNAAGTKVKSHSRSSTARSASKSGQQSGAKRSTGNRQSTGGASARGPKAAKSSARSNKKTLRNRK